MAWKVLEHRDHAKLPVRLDVLTGQQGNRVWIGSECPAHSIVNRIFLIHPEVHHGGQPLYPYLFSVE